jgi:hypothetical protein
MFAYFAELMVTVAKIIAGASRKKALLMANYSLR